MQDVVARFVGHRRSLLGRGQLLAANESVIYHHYPILAAKTIWIQTPIQGAAAFADDFVVLFKFPIFRREAASVFYNIINGNRRLHFSLARCSTIAVSMQ